MALQSLPQVFCTFFRKEHIVCCRRMMCAEVNFFLHLQHYCNNMEVFQLMLQQTLIITTFVLGLMMVIEYVNIQTRGLWSEKIQRKPIMQILLGSLMGVIPGCLGSYTMVSLYVHRVVMFPAIVATMIATSGDEAFLMFSVIPAAALKLNIILFFVALLAGILIHYTVRNKYIGLGSHAELPLHSHVEECNPLHPRYAINNLKSVSFTRALLLVGILGVLFMLVTGVVDGAHHLNTLMGDAGMVHDHAHDHAHDHSHGGEADWIRLSLIGLFVILLFIVLSAREHFLQEHLWHHIIKKHFFKIFAWTLGVLAFIYFLNQYVDLRQWISENVWMVLFIALMIGIIPESGPHYVFVLLFAQGAVPFSILLASSIAQDGHGTLPLLAESPRGFVAVKIANLMVAFLAGSIGILMGW